MWWPGRPVAGRPTAGIGIGAAGVGGEPAESRDGGPEPVDVPPAVAASDTPRAGATGNRLRYASRTASGHPVTADPLHYDHDFDLIGDLTGRPMEWIVPGATVG